MGDSPGTLIRSAWAVGAWGIVIGAILIPVLSAVTQWVNVKLMPQQPTNGNEKASSMAASMKTMNMLMPHDVGLVLLFFTVRSGSVLGGRKRGEKYSAGSDQ